MLHDADNDQSYVTGPLQSILLQGNYPDKYGLAKYCTVSIPSEHLIFTYMFP